MTEFTKKYKRRSELFGRVVAAGQHLLYNDPLAEETRNYIDSRLPVDVQKQYGLGYFPDNDNLSHIYPLVERNDLEELGLIYKRFIAGGSYIHGHFSVHNMILPFFDSYGNIISLLGRCLLPEQQHKELGIQKYQYSIKSDKDLYVFGLEKAIDSIIENDCVIGVEGQFDCIACHMRGIKNVVAFGWANLSRYQFFQLHRYTNNIIVLTDGDEAGIGARKKIKARYSKHANILTMSQPKGYKDIEEFFRKCQDQKEIDAVINRLKTIHQEI